MPGVVEGIHWLEGAAGALGGAIVGSFIPLVWMRGQRRKERLGELLGMRSELVQAKVCIEALLGDRVFAPLYRLPLSIFKTALPKLIGDGVLHPIEVSALVEYLNAVDELNRGLDRASEAALIEGQSDSLKRAIAAEMLTNEYNRNMLKAENLLDRPLPRLNGGSIIDCAWNALVRGEIEHTRSCFTFLFGTLPSCR